MTLFKEYKKTSLSDTRRTFEDSVESDLERLISTNSDEFTEYLLNVCGHIKEYYSQDEVSGPSKPQQDKTYAKYSICNYIVSSKTNNTKSEIYKKYMQEFHNKSNVTMDSSTMCSKCDNKYSMLLDQQTSTYVCEQCGNSETCLDTGFSIKNAGGFSLEDLPDLTPHYSYKRSNHFSEWLSQLQARESTTIPESVLDLIYKELKKERITDKNMITHVRIRGYLKKLKQNKYYEHIPHIIRTIKNEKVPTLSMDTESMLRYMFNMIQVPFEKHCPKTRKNFLSYSYTLYKMAQIIGEDEMIEKFYLPLLKSRDKLAVQDTIWKGICSELNWEFIPTV